MPHFTRFIIGFVVGFPLGIGITIGLLYAQLGVSTESSRPIFDMIQKKERLAANISGPRLLLVAGSSTLFGLNAQMIQEQTGVPTINLGTHAGLGIDYILEIAQRTARPGDTVLLALEYEFYTDPYDQRTETYDDYILAHDPDYFRQLALWDKICMATLVPIWRFRKGIENQITPEPRPKPDPPYTDAATFLNNNGDEIGSAKALRPSIDRLRTPIANLIDGISSSQAHFDRLKQFLGWARHHHVVVLAAFPNVVYQPEYDQPNGQQAISVITDFYRSQGIQVIGTAREAMLPTDDFFDSHYHLTREAAETRTYRLIPELKPYLSAAK